MKTVLPGGRRLRSGFEYFASRLKKRRELIPRSIPCQIKTTRHAWIVWCIQATDNMYVTVDERDTRPLYQQLVDEIKTLIARGELTQGTLLPPVRQVGSGLGGHLNTAPFAHPKTP